LPPYRVHISRRARLPPVAPDTQSRLPGVPQRPGPTLRPPPGPTAGLSGRSRLRSVISGTCLSPKRR